jgi:hypothetical protein
VPLEILHRAAPCRNVPVTFTLDLTMALDVGFLRNDGILDVRFRFAEDGTYEFLQPWFLQVRQAAGKYVDLYGDATFDSSNGLKMLVDAVRSARAKAESQPRVWEVHVGTQLRPERKELFRAMDRRQLLSSIDRLAELLQEAADLDRPLVFRGD